MKILREKLPEMLNQASMGFSNSNLQNEFTVKRVKSQEETKDRFNNVFICHP